MRNNTAPPVPIIIALFCCFFGKFFVAIAITTALSPDNTISIAMIFKRAVREDEVSSIANTMGPPSCKKQPCYTYFFFLLTNYTVFRSEEHTSELQSRFDLVCRLTLEKKNTH